MSGDLSLKKSAPGFKYYITLLSLFALYGFNYNNGDYATYQMMFDFLNPRVWGLELGFGYLGYWAKLLGLTFFQFKFVITALIFLLIHSLIKEKSSMPFCLLLVYSVVYFPLDYVLIRNTLSFFLMLQFISFRGIEKDNFKSKIMAITGILIASLFHNSMLMFFIFLPLYVYADFFDKHIKLFLLASLVTGMLLIFLKGLLPFGHRVALYPSNFKTFFFQAGCLGFHFVFIFLWVKICNLNIKLIKINLYSLFFILPMAIAPIAIRGVRFVTFINFILILDKKRLSLLTNKQQTVFFVSITIYMVLLFSYFNLPFLEGTLFSLKNNYLLDLIRLD